ncbi:MAG: hypothetical protein BZY81_01245 [SAR202 cluster bacterium Io17-Chloro-G4]|nr:MAG: hypothetical protein BZY81_01245 [SAR202 cluster bacterium Io17-Chloro-G4]
MAGVDSNRLAEANEIAAPRQAQGIFYGWWLVAISGFVMVISTVPLFHAMSVWAVALERHFGWSRAQLGFALTFTRIEGGLMGPVEGYLTDRVGTRRMVLIGLIILGLGFLFFGRVQNLWMFYLAYVFMAVGQGLGSWIPVMTMLNHWFSRRRSTAMAWANVGSRAGALLLVPAIAWAIDPDHDRFGWQVTATAIGVFLLVVAFPLSRLIRNKPQDYNLLPDNDPPAAQAQAEPDTQPARGQGAAQGTSSDLTPSQALRTPAFWLIAFGHGFTSMVILAIMAHLGLMMEDKGFEVQDTAWIVIVYLSFAMVFQLVGGYLGDRVPKRFALFGFTSLQAGAVVLLASASSLSAFYLFAVLFGMGFGGRNPLTVAIRGDYFGRASFGKILGLSTVPMNLLLLIAAPLAGYMRDVQGTYTQAFYLLAALNFVGAVLFLLARRPVAPQRAVEVVAPQASD